MRTPGSGCVSPSDLEHAFTGLLLRTLRKLALEEGLRADGRGLIDCRELHCEVRVIVLGSWPASIFAAGCMQAQMAPMLCEGGERPSLAVATASNAWLVLNMHPIPARPACQWPYRLLPPPHLLLLLQIDTVPIVHGSALFMRGETQSLCTATVGGRGDEQRTESLLEGEGAKRLAVHYSFPAFAINEVGRFLPAVLVAGG